MFYLFLRGFCLLAMSFVWSASFAENLSLESEFSEAHQAYITARNTGNKQQTLETARITADVAEELFGEADDRFAIALTDFGAALLQSEQDRRARVVLDRAFELMRDIHGKKSPALVPVLLELADASAEFHNPINQIGYYRRALHIISKSDGKDSLRYADVSLRAGKNILSRSWTNKGISFLYAAFDIYVETLGPLSKKAGIAAYHLGKTRFSEQRHKAALPHFLNALAAFDNGSEDRLENELVTRALLVQTYEVLGESELSTSHCVVIGQKSDLRGDADAMAIFQITPEYPERALRSELEGFVDVGFTIDEQGFVRDTVALRSSNPVFEVAALEAVAQSRYAPRIVDGEPVQWGNRKRRLRFAIAD